MATRVTTYDPAKVDLVVAGNIITGFASGRMLEYRPDAPVWQDALGVDNEPVRWQTNNPMATLIFNLTQSSTSNFVLGALLNVDKLTASSPAPVLMEDRSGTGAPTIIIAKLGWLNSQPVLAWGAGPEARQWSLRLLMPMRPIMSLQGLE